MVRAWFMDDDTVSDQRLDHHKCPQEFIDVNELYKLSGVEYFKVTIDFESSFIYFLQELHFLIGNYILDLMAPHKKLFLSQSIAQLLHI